MILYKYLTKIEKLDSQGAYFMADDMGFACHLMDNRIFSTEVDIINSMRYEFADKGKNLNFIDIGANVGTYSIVLGEVFNHTYAFEPDKHNYNILCGNIALHNLSYKSDLYNIGLSDKKDTLEYHYVDFVGGGNFFAKPNDESDISNNLSHQYDFYSDDSTRTETMSVDTLDSFNIKNVGLIKIDVEGFELNVIKGGLNTIKASGYPPLLVESWDVKTDDTEVVSEAKIKLRNDLFSYLDNLDYKVERFENDVFYCRQK